MGLIDYAKQDAIDESIGFFKERLKAAIDHNRKISLHPVEKKLLWEVIDELQ